MAWRLLGWFALISVIILGLFGIVVYVTILTFLVSFTAGLLTVLYYNYDEKKIFSVDLDCLDNPLQQVNFSVQPSKVAELFQKGTVVPKFDNRITGSDTVDAFLNEIISIIINDYVTTWYQVITSDEEFTTHSIKRLVISAGANLANRVKCVDWVQLLSTKFPDELTVHLKLFKQSRVRLKHLELINAKDVGNGNSKYSPKREEKRTHRRNKSETDLPWLTDSQTFGKSKFYSSSDNVSGNTLKDLFFDLECSMENKQLCRDIFCTDAEKEYALLSEISEVLLYLVGPEEAWNCHALKIMLVELLSSVVLRPLINLLSDPDNINRAIIRNCCRDAILPSDLFLLVIRCSMDAEELDATLDSVQKDIQKLHSKDSAGEWDLQDRQKLSSLQYVTRIIHARRATLGPQEDLSSSSSSERISDEVARTLKFLRATAAWRSNAQYLLEIDMSESDTHTSKAVLDNLRSSALELCDMYLTPNGPAVIGVPDNYYVELVRKITTEGEEFTNNPVVCFDDLQKCVCDALEEDPLWQADFMMDGDDGNNSDTRKHDKTDTKKYSGKYKRMIKSCLEQLPKWLKSSKNKYEAVTKIPKSNTFPRSVSKRTPCYKNHTLPKCKYYGDNLPIPGARHNRSRSDIVGNFAQNMISEGTGSSNLASGNTSSLSMSYSEISKNAKNLMSPLSASIIETALVQEKGRAFGIYAISVTRLSDNEVWHIYRRYSDFYDLHQSIKDKWPELSHLPFPAKKTFQNTSRTVLENRKRVLNSYLQSLSTLAKEARYMALLSQDYLGGFLSPEIQTEKHSNAIDALFVNPIKAGMRTLKNMPDQFVNTVDGVMDGISKVFQGKTDNFYDDLKSGNSSDGQDDGDESGALRLLEEVLGIKGLWLRRRLLAPIRTIIGDRVNRKVLELVSSLTSPGNVVHYLKSFKQWLTSRNHPSYGDRDAATKARTRVAAKVALLSACSDDIKHIVGTDTARRSLLTVFDMFQTQEINKRLIFVLLEAILVDLFPDNNMSGMFKKLYSNSPKVPATKRSVNV